MSRAVLSLGSNMSDPRAQLTSAVRALGPAVLTVSSVYLTPPWGPVEQDDFENIVLIAEVDDADEERHNVARSWLERCRELEVAAGRRRTIHWGPRTLDADVITVEQRDRLGQARPILSDDPELTLPHPRAAERAFVMLPWAEIDPAATLPGHGPIAELLAGLNTAGIRLVGHVGR